MAWAQMLLPQANPGIPFPQSDAAPAQRKAGGGGESILIVEDDPMVLTYLKLVTERAGYRTLLAANGTDAVELLRREPGVSLVISDVVMPGGGGQAVQAEVDSARLPAKVLFISGYPREVVADRGIPVDQVEFLQKPVHGSVLLQKVRELLL
ncbi:MAG TPA: response regulator [Verrucomicrobiae bacterium]|nr:response regulator [Verrucomicrobiae bacterium]